MLPPIKIKTNLKVSQAMPYLEVIAQLDKIPIWKDLGMTQAYNKFLILLLICEQNGLNYEKKREFFISMEIYKKSINQN